MSIDNIVKINISTQSLSMAQMGFGTPLIMGSYDYFEDRVKTFSDLSELPYKEGMVYETAKSLLSQSPRVTKFKIGRCIKEKSIIENFQEILDEDFNFYGLLLANVNGEDIKNLAKEVASKRILMGLDLDDDLLPIADELKDKNYKNIFSIYKTKTTDYPSAAWMGKMFPKAPGSATWAFQELQGISKGILATSKSEELKSQNINRYINIKDVGLTLDGKVASGEYIDVICGIDWLHVRLQERIFRLLMINEKIPYTLKGIDLVRSEIIAQLKEAVYQGVLASDPEPQVSTPTIDEIDPQIRGQRLLPKVKFSGRMQGAIHEIHIEGMVGP